MNLGVVLPNTQLFGGVKRFFELGNYFVESGHSMVVFSPEGERPSWFDFHGEVKAFTELTDIELDVLFFTELKFLDLVKSAKARRIIFYHVLASKKIRSIVEDKSIEIFSNSSNVHALLKSHFGIDTFKAYGGVNVSTYRHALAKDKEETFNILTYGRLNRKRKGTRFVVKACEWLYRRHKNIKLILFDTPIDKKGRELIKNFSCDLPFEFVVGHPVERNFELYRRANLFISAEKRAGWANTCAEAMASGVPVIATSSGSRDILINGVTGISVWRNPISIAWAAHKLITSPDYAQELSDNALRHIEQFDWSVLAKRILEHLES